jgi:two-component system KDP operon response regulator KdpE
MNETTTVLVVEDDPYILKLCTIFLKDDGYRVLQALNGREALTVFNSEEPDVVLLDLGLPDIDGLELIPLFRQHSAAPVIVISARSEESEKIRALDLGADDYMSKPFHTGELMARIRAARRRQSQSVAQPGESVFRSGDLTVDFQKELVAVCGEPVHLTPIEYRLLCLLIRNRGKVLTHHYIQEQIWGAAEQTDAKNLRVFMANLRRKIEGEGPERRYIRTQVGVGYRFLESPPGPAGDR